MMSRRESALSAEVGELRIQLFEGTAEEVELELNEFLRETKGSYKLVDIGYNYQGEEYVDRTKIAGSASHGVCLLLQRLNI